MATVNEKMTVIADAIRGKTGATEPLTLDDMAAEIPEVYETGKDEINKALWAMRLRGDRTNWEFAFYHEDFRELPFDPPETIYPTNARYMFSDSKFCCKNGVITKSMLDTSKLTNATNMFYSNYYQHKEYFEIDELNCSKATELTYTFNYCKVTRIGKLILKEGGTNTFSSTFGMAYDLKDITIEGRIGRDISFKDSPLTPASMKSVINALMDYSTENTHTYTVTFKSSCWTALEAESTPKDEGIDFEGTWKEYVYAKGWNY